MDVVDKNAQSRRSEKGLNTKKEIFEGFSDMLLDTWRSSPETVGAARPALANQQVIITFPCGAPVPPLLSHSGTGVKSDYIHTVE